MSQDSETKVLKDFESKLADRYWRLNNLYWIMTDKGEKTRFRVNRVQYWLYTTMWWLNIILKSRQHGITTFICLFFLDACLFNNDIRAGIIAHRLDDAKRIFRDKILYAYNLLKEEWPELVPAGLEAVEENTQGLRLQNNSSIEVGTSMRSGTLQYLHISEYGWTCFHAPQKAREIKSGALETIHAGGIVFIEATAEGAGTDFQAMCKEAEAIHLAGRQPEKMEFKFHFFAWYEKPENTTDPNPQVYAPLNAYFDGLEKTYKITLTPGQRTWYALKKKTLASDIYKEHPSTPDEAFFASLEGSYFGPEMTAAKESGQIRRVPYDPAAKVFTFWDGGNIYTSVGFFQFQGDDIRQIDELYDELGQGLPYFARQILQERKYVYGGHFIGHDYDESKGSNAKTLATGRTILDHARELGIDLKAIDKYSFNDRIRETKNVIPRILFDEEKCKMTYTALMMHRRRKNEQLSTAERPVFFEEEVHDWTSHLSAMIGHMALKYRTLSLEGKRIGSTMQTQPMHPQHSAYSNKILTRGRKIA